MIKNQILAIIFILSGINFFAPADDAHGTTETGEGNELVVTEGVVIREVPPAEPDLLPQIAVGSADGVHTLFDPNQFTNQGIWAGLFGRTGEDQTFAPNLTKLKSFALDQAPPWSFGEKPRRRVTHQWTGASIENGKPVFRYQLSDEESGMVWKISETMEYVSEQVQHIHFDIEPNQETDLYLNYWVRQTEFRRLTTNGQQNQRNRLKNLLPNQKQFTITFQRRKETPTVPNGYSIREIEVPAPPLPMRFEPTDIDFAEDGTAYCTTRTGGVWHYRNEKWTLFADGLHETNGLQVTEEGVYVMQKPELTLLKDTDGDGIADVYQTVEDDYRFAGTYHEFVYGPRRNQQGEMFFSTGLSSRGHHRVTDTNPNQMTSPLGYRGWVIKRDTDGNMVPFAAGLRSPAGIGMNRKDELFIVDNQGDWVASSYLGHVTEGDFMGHPASLWDRPEHGLTPDGLDYKKRPTMPESVVPLDKAEFSKFRKLPAVWLSHGDLTNSPGHPSFAPQKGFGPFADQAFIADIAHRNVVRVALEKVDGEYQGVVFPFIRPLKSASYSTAFDAEGNLWVGSVGRGWTAGDPAIEIISFDENKTPFEMLAINLTKTGFDIKFTEALADQEVSVKDISIKEYQYQYWDGYGSEPINVAMVPATKVTLSEDRLTLSVELPLKAEFIYQIQLPEYQSQSGLSLDNNYGVYTLNRLLP